RFARRTVPLFTRGISLISYLSLSALAYLYGSILASFGASTSATTVVPLSFRFRVVVLLLRMCCLNALLRRNFPRLVRLNRFAAPRCVLSFSFGICPLYVVVLCLATGLGLPPPA